MTYDEFDEYVKQSEPHKKQRGIAWQTAIGLQDVDGLKTSEYLLQTAQKHIEGDITIRQAKQLVDTYYESKVSRVPDDDRTEEADKVSARIAEILGEQTFNFTPAEYISIHRRLFTGIYKFAGKIRDYNITKKEWVLRGKTVLYASADSIRETLDYDFEQEKNFSYENLPLSESVKHITRFVSGLWQIHAFGEGNTRTTAVFTIKYLRSFGFSVDNDSFAENSWYFRNALVRANYADIQNGISYTTEYLERFFRNLLMNEHNELKNRYLLTGKNPFVKDTQSAADDTLKSENGTLKDTLDSENDSKYQNDTLNDTLKCSLMEWAVIRFLKENPKATQKEIAAKIGKSEITVKRITASLASDERGILKRVNGKRNGWWEVRGAEHE
jgi:fido (protein-threonine AMPylation protein)